MAERGGPIGAIKEGGFEEGGGCKPERMKRKTKFPEKQFWGGDFRAGENLRKKGPFFGGKGEKGGGGPGADQKKGETTGRGSVYLGIKGGKKRERRLLA